MKSLGRITNKTNFKVKNGFQFYKSLSIVAGIFLLSAIPLGLWAYIQHPDWLNGITQNDRLDGLPNSSESVNPLKTNEQEDQTKEDNQNPTAESKSSGLSSRIFTRLQDQTADLNKKGEESKSPNPKISPLTNLFPSLPKAFISPFEAARNNNTLSNNNQQIIKKTFTTTQQIVTPTENSLSSAIKQLNTNQTATAPNGTYQAQQPYQTSPYQGQQTYQTNPYQYQTNPYQYQTNPYQYQTNPYQYQTNPYQYQQPNQSSPYQVQQPNQSSPYQVQQPNQASPYQAQQPNQGQQGNNFQNFKGEPSGNGTAANYFK